jgi:hypothetical protein
MEIHLENMETQLYLAWMAGLGAGLREEWGAQSSHAVMQQEGRKYAKDITATLAAVSSLPKPDPLPTPSKDENAA